MAVRPYSAFSPCDHPLFEDEDNASAVASHADLAMHMRWLLLVGLAVCMLAFEARAGTLDTLSERRTLRIGYVVDEAPFSSVSPDTKPTGYAIDLCGKVADEIEHVVPQLKREYVEMTLANGFDAVKNGQVELLCGAITVNLERRENVDFSQPIFLTGASALLRKDSPDYLQTLFFDRLAVRSVSQHPASTGVIGVRANTTTSAILREAGSIAASKTQIADFDTHEDGLKALEEHKIDAYFGDRVLLMNLAKRARNPSSLAVGDRLFTHEPYAIALKRDDADFRLLVDRALTEFYLSDDFLPLLETYFGNEAPMLHTLILMEHVP